MFLIGRGRGPITPLSPAVTQPGSGRSPALQHWDVADRAALGEVLNLPPCRGAGGACTSPAGANLGILPVHTATNIVFSPWWLRHQLCQGH